VHWYMRDRTLEDMVTEAPHLGIAVAWACMAFAIIITQGKGDAFIYFQF
jgi:alginate O-acetyltransferase complex protein AlgI